MAAVVLLNKPLRRIIHWISFVKVFFFLIKRINKRVDTEFSFSCSRLHIFVLRSGRFMSEIFLRPFHPPFLLRVSSRQGSVNVVNPLLFFFYTRLFFYSAFTDFQFVSSWPIPGNFLPTRAFWIEPTQWCKGI